MKCVQKHCLNENWYALQVFLCALISRPVCACRCAQLRGHIVWMNSWVGGWIDRYPCNDKVVLPYHVNRHSSNYYYNNNNNNYDNLYGAVTRPYRYKGASQTAYRFLYRWLMNSWMDGRMNWRMNGWCFGWSYVESIESKPVSVLDSCYHSNSLLQDMEGGKAGADTAAILEKLNTG